MPRAAERFFHRAPMVGLLLVVCLNAWLGGSLRVSGLFWFHARRDDSVAGITSVLRSGAPVAARRGGGDTEQLELDLGLPPNVYCYLGRTLESFGSFAFAVSSAAALGKMSPFDTGG